MCASVVLFSLSETQWDHLWKGDKNYTYAEELFEALKETIRETYLVQCLKIANIQYVLVINKNPKSLKFSFFCIFSLFYQSNIFHKFTTGSWF